MNDDDDTLSYLRRSELGWERSRQLPLEGCADIKGCSSFQWSSNFVKSVPEDNSGYVLVCLVLHFFLSTAYNGVWSANTGTRSVSHHGHCYQVTVRLPNKLLGIPGPCVQPGASKHPQDFTVGYLLHAWVHLWSVSGLGN